MRQHRCPEHRVSLSPEHLLQYAQCNKKWKTRNWRVDLGLSCEANCAFHVQAPFQHQHSMGTLSISRCSTRNLQILLRCPLPVGFRHSEAWLWEKYSCFTGYQPQIHLPISPSTNVKPFRAPEKAKPICSQSKMCVNIQP